MKKCVKEVSGILPGGDIYQQGRNLAKFGQYDWAMQVLAAVQNQIDPRVLNMADCGNR